MEKSRKQLLKKLLLIFTATLIVFSVFGTTFTQHSRSASAANYTLTYSSGWVSQSTTAFAIGLRAEDDVSFYGFHMSSEDVNSSSITNISNTFSLLEEYYDITLKFPAANGGISNGDEFQLSFVGAPVELSSVYQQLNIIVKKENNVLLIYFNKGNKLSSKSYRAGYYYDENGEKNYNIGGSVDGISYDAIRIDASATASNVSVPYLIVNIRFHYGLEDTKVVVDTKYPSYYSTTGDYLYKEFEYDEGGERPAEFFVPGELLRNNLSRISDHLYLRFKAAALNTTKFLEDRIKLSLSNSDPDYSALKQENAYLRRQIDEKNSLITALQATTATLSDRELELTESINTLESRIASLQADYNNNFDEIITLRAEKMALEKQLEVVNSQNAQYASQLATTTKEMETLTAKLYGAEKGEENGTEEPERSFFESVGEWISNNVLYTVLIGVGIVAIIATPIVITVIKKKRS